MARISPIEKRAKILVEYGCVSLVEEGKQWTVRSQTDTGVSYSVTKDSETG